MSRLVSLADDAGNVKNELDFARISGREAQGLEARFGQTISALAEAAQNAEKIANELHVHPGRLSSLAHVNKDPRHAGDVQLIRGWVEEVRQRTGTSQAGFDSQLYQKNAQVRAACDELAAMSRLELAQEALLDAKAGLLGRLDPKTPVVMFAFGGEVVRVTPHMAGSTTRRALDLQPVGAATDLQGAIQTALEAAGEKTVEAVIVLSDGREVEADAGRRTVAGRARVPVIAVSVASANVRDLAIAGMELPRSAYLGEAFHARVEVRSSVDPSHLNGMAKLTLGATVATSQPVRASQGKAEPVDFQAVLEKAGPVRVSVSLPPQKEEVSVVNNQVERWMKGLSQKMKVTLVASNPGWDVRYVRSMLARAPWVALSDHVLGGEDMMLPMGSEDLLEQDVVMLFDVSAGSLTREQWVAIRRLAEERGGAVILVAGDEHLPAEYTSGELAKFLPWARGWPVWRTWPGETAYYKVSPVQTGNGFGLHLDLTLSEDQRRWNELRPFYRYLELPALRGSVRPLLVERESRAPILTEANLGRGRVLFLGMNETWRWRYRVGERDQDRFWTQLIRHAAEEPYALSSGGISFDADTFSMTPRESVHVRLKLAGRKEPMPETLELSVMREGGIYQIHPLRAVGPADAGRFEASVGNLPSGDYELRPPARGAEAEGMALPLHVGENLEAEMRDLSGDADHLREVAQGSGGKQITLEGIAGVPQLLVDVSSRQPRVVEMPLWDSYYLYFFVLGCLAAEWSLRKHFGLA